MGFLTAWTFIKGIFSKLSLKGILIFLAILALLYGLYRLEQYGEHKQAAIDAPVIKAANDARDKAIAQEQAYQKSYAGWVKASNDATAALKAQQATDLADVQKKLDAALAAGRQKQIVYKEVTKYVTATDDAHCTISSGFVQLYNGTLEGPDASGSFGISNSTGIMADTPTSLKLSQLSSVLVNNNIQALSWRAQVIAWQSWYKDNLASFNAAQQKADAAKPVETVTH